MNKYITVLLASLTGCATSFATITNYVNLGSPDPDTLSNTNYIGTTGNAAASITNITSLSVYLSSFAGGDGTSTGSSSDGLAGLMIEDVDSVVISNRADNSILVTAGMGGNANQTDPTGTSTADARGGDAVRFNVLAGSTSQNLDVQSAYLVGANGGTATGTERNKVYADGGAGLRTVRGTVNIGEGTFNGGNAGSSTVATAGSGSIASSRGGDGISLDALFTTVNGLGSAIVAQGGNGGTANGAETSDISGGDGMRMVRGISSLPSFPTIGFSGGSFTGGDGGSGTGLIDAFSYGGNGASFELNNLNITSGTFTGGAGGVANAADARAYGGSGLFAFFGGMNILGGSFNGGMAGTTNGVSDRLGYGLELHDCITVISGATVSANSLFVESAFRPITTDIYDASLGDVTFVVNPNPNSGSLIGGNTVTISDATLLSLSTGGEGGHTITVTGGSIGDLSLANKQRTDAVSINGSAMLNDIEISEDGDKSLSIADTVNSSGKVEQLGGSITINQWSDKHFTDTTISQGTMSFNGSFNLQNGSTFALDETTSRVNFNNDVTLQGGSSLNIAEGLVSTPSFTATNGAVLSTTVNEDESGTILGDNISLGSIRWDINGTSSVSSISFDLAVSTASLNMPTNFVKNENWSSTVVNPTNWLYGITDVYATNQFIRADYGEQSVDVALGLDDPSSEALLAYGEDYLAAAQAFDSHANSNPDAKLTLLALGTLESAREAFPQITMYTPEMANMLLRQQEIYSDQIRDRTGSFRHQKNYSASYTLPAGAPGPENWEPEYWYEDTKNAIKEHTPKIRLKGDFSTEQQKPFMSSRHPSQGTVYDSAKGVAHKIIPEKDVNVGKAMQSFEEKSKPYTGDLKVPASYQVWGRAFSSWYDQDPVDLFAGYDARVYGAAVGIDRRFESLMVGIGGGFADSRVDGNAGHNGDAISGYGTIYAAVEKAGFYLDLSANYAMSQVETDVAIGPYQYQGEFDADSVGLYVGGGFNTELFGKSIYNVLLTPEISILSTYYEQDAYTEKSLTPGPDKQWDAYDQWSYIGSLGVTLSKTHKVQSFKMELEFKPELRAHWLHDFNADMDKPTFLVEGSTASIGAILQPREEDLLKVGGGVRFNSWYSDSLEFGLDFDGTFGKDYTAYVLSGKLLHRF